MEMDKAVNVLSELQECIQQTTDDVKLLKSYIKVEKRLRQEIQFLRKKPTARTNRSSSNLPYLYGVIEAVKQSRDVQNVITDWRKYNLRIDLVCDGGKTWKKVVARNPQSLHLVWAGQGQYGSKDVVSTVSKYLEAAKKESDFSPPNVICVFANGVTNEMADHIESLGAGVEGERVPVADDILRRLQGGQATEEDDSEYSDSEEEYSSEDNEEAGPADLQCNAAASEEIAKIIALPTDEKIFLDVTTMVIYVSDVCNGGENFEFKDSMMAEQAEQERVTPVRPFIEQHMQNHQLITCQAALDNYKSFMDLLGGEEEQKRADELVKRLTVVPDDMSDKFASLKEHGKIKERSKRIFGTADKLRCNILTSNESFLRAATAQGLTVSAIVHQSRALSELKRLEESAADSHGC